MLTGVTAIAVARSAAGFPAPQMSEADATLSMSSSAAESGTSCHSLQSSGVNVTDATSAETAGTPPERRTSAATAAAGCAASLKRATAEPPSGTDTAAFSATTAIASAKSGSRMR